MSGRWLGGRAVGLALSAWIWAGAITLAAEPTDEGESPTVTATWQQILAADAAFKAQGVTPGGPKVIPFQPAPTTRRGLAGAGAATPEPSAREGQGPESPGSWIRAQVKRNFLALPDNGAVIPPDTIGAVGPNHLMTMLNSEVRIQTKDGTNLGTASLSAWWNHPPVTGSPFDPKVYYDIPAGRWIAVCDANGGASSSKVFFAISATSDPTGTWYFKSYVADSQGTYWADFPSVGFNKNWIAIINNMFTVSTDEYGGAKAWVIDKPNAMNGTINARPFNRGFDNGVYGVGFTLKPCETYDPNEETLYVVDNFWADVDPNDPNNPDKYIPQVRLSQFHGTPSSVDWTEQGFFNVAHQFSFFQIDATQKGDSHGVSTNDPRVFSAVLRNGHIWFTHTAALPPPTASVNRTAAFWYEVDPLNASTPIVQSGFVDGGTGRHYFFSSIAVNTSNDACLGFSYSHLGIYAAGAWTFRAANDPLGTLRTPSILKAGEAAYYKTYGGFENRWGDYSATSVDPTNDRTFWTIQEYAWAGSNENERDLWSTWWGEIRLFDDCNLNGVPDECDIQCGSGCDPNTCGQSQDCNGNGVPDECEMPQITAPPVSATACTGTAVTFGCQATGVNTLAYKWRKNGAAISGATASSYTIASVTDSDTASYDVVVSDSMSPCLTVTSGAATLTLQPRTVIATQPQPQQTVVLGDGVAFTVSATGPGTLTYQWRKDGQPLAGAVQASYQVPVAVAGDAGVYDVVVASACAALTSQPAQLTIALHNPSLLSPSNGALNANTDTSLTWNGVFGADQYDVYFGTTNPPPLVGSTAGTLWKLPLLDYDITYYWQVVARASGAVGESLVWSFRTHPGPPIAPAGPSPADGTTGVATDIELNWGGSDGATLFKVLIGQDATLKDARFEGTTLSKRWARPDIAAGTTYYWRVIAKSDWGVTAGPVWSFSTAPKPVEVPDTNAPSSESPTQAPTEVPATTQPSDTTAPADGGNAALTTPTSPTALCPATGAAMVSALLLGLWSTRPRSR